MSRFHKVSSGLVAVAMLMGSALSAAAQSTPEATGEATAADPRVQLAAVTPGSEDLPTGFVFLGETFLEADQLSDRGFDPAALTGAGFSVQYVSVYTNPDTGEVIRAYASWWGSDEAAATGFAMLEDEATTNPGDALSDGGTEVGEEPREITTGTYAAPDGAVTGTIDVTFRRGPMIVGVAHDAPNAAPADASIATGVAARVDERAQAVLNGDALPHVDVTLPSRIVRFAGDGNAVAQAGFLGPVETEAIYGVQGSLLSGIDSSWVETTMIGSTGPDAPTVTVGLSTFANDQDATFAAEQAEDLFEALPSQENVDGVKVEGADAVSAFRYSSDGSGALDSYRLIIASGGLLTVVDVQGAATDGGAEAAINAISTAQITCQSGGACETPVLPVEFNGQ